MAGLGDIFGSLGLGNIASGGIMNLIIYMILGVLIMGSIGAFFYSIYYKKKKWFLNVEVKMPRSDGNFLNAEWAKGTYDAKRGVVLIKRHKKKAVPMKPFDIKRYLQGQNILSVVQIGIEEFKPVLPQSFLTMYDDSTGEEASIMKMKVDTSESKAWKESFERDSKNAYSIQSLLGQYAQYIGFGILFFMIFVGFAILYGRIK